MQDRSPPENDAPRLLTLLLTDLCDSTTLVERLGDAPAAELFREHDRLVLQLQQRWRGRLIDRSDGLLLLFERSVDGVGFALDYTQGLRALGEPRGVVLRARAGLHVGEVLTWRNSEEAVSIGAKALEVEGLAKPMAGRLMAMARPEQLLLSSVAESLARRSVRELGERGDRLLWRFHGRWRLKGIPAVQEIHEVGEAGIAPLRAPRNGPKAWRDLPLWRRPVALATELLLLAGIAVGVWFMTRPQPAIAFAERDWVVVGDLRNLTGKPILDESLQQAFRISLEQSHYVNVLSDLKARDTLTRMQRDPATPLDRTTASEIALRDGVRAVILPSVAEIGGRVRVSVEVVDPHTQATVYAESADGTGLDSVLDSIDTAAAALRGRLGETLGSVHKDSVPLPKVTTRNLDALRAYALAQKAYALGNSAVALQFYERATQLDAGFALAWLGQARARYSLVDAPGGLAPLRKAQSLRDKLPPREALYLDAWVAWFDAPEHALDAWRQLAALYPDYWQAQGNTALALYAENRFQEALPYALAVTSPQFELAPIGYDTVGRINLGLGDYAAAESAFDQAIQSGLDSSVRRRAAVAAAQRRYGQAEYFLQRTSDEDRYAYLEKASIAIDRGDWRSAQDEARTGLRMAVDIGFDGRLFQLPVAVSDWLAGERESARVRAREVSNAALAALAQDYDADAADDAALALSAALLAQRLGDHALPRRVLAALDGMPGLMRKPALAEQAMVVRAEAQRLAGKPEAALRLLRPLVTGHERYQTRVALLKAAMALDDTGAALEHARWLQQRRGLAYAELGCGYCLQALNVADSNAAVLSESEILRRSGKPADAGKPPAAVAHVAGGRRAGLFEPAFLVAQPGIQIGRDLAQVAGQHPVDLPP